MHKHLHQFWRHKPIKLQLKDWTGYSPCIWVNETDEECLWDTWVLHMIWGEALDDMDLQDSSPLPFLKLDTEKMSEGPSLKVSNMESWNQERITPTVALKSTGSSFDLFFTDPCVSFEPGAQQPNGLHLIQPVLAIHEELQLGVCGWSNTGLPLHQYSFLKYLQSPTIFYFSPHLLPPGLLTNNLSMVRNIHHV